MRCPYCGGFNQDTTTFCRSCGRDLSGPVLRTPVNKQPVPQPPRATRSAPPPPQRPPYPAPKSPYPVAPVQASSQPSTPQNVPGPYATRQRPMPTPTIPSAPVTPTEPEPPAPFPPRTVEQLRALEQGALNYTLVSDDENVGRKRIIRVAYAPCASWQQLATLYKVLNECKDDHAKKFDTVIIQGVTDVNADDLYSFNHGQLIFDRGVRLGSEVLNRYQLETGNGFAGDALRVVLTEVVK
jgi:hypothetical protein